jgi:hypothetical protein
LICILLSLASLTLGVGYAQLSSTISLEATITGSMQKGVFISNVTEPQGITINTYFSTVLNSEVVLTNSNDTKTLTITLYNNSPDNYAFDSIGYDAAIAGGYTNSNITFTHMLQKYQRIDGKQSLEFTITFAFKSGYTPTTAESLQSILNFHFHLWGAEDNTDYESFLSSFLVDPKKGYGLNDTGNGDKGPAVIAAIKQEKIVYPHTKIKGGNLEHLSNGITDGLTFVYQYVNDTTFYLYTYEDKYCESSYEGEPVDCYRTTLDYNTETEKWEIQSTYSGKATIEEIENHYYINYATWIGNMI